MRKEFLVSAVKAMREGKDPEALIASGEIEPVPEPNTAEFIEKSVAKLKKKHPNLQDEMRRLVPNYEDTLNTVKELLHDEDPKIRLGAAKLNMDIYKEYFRVIAAKMKLDSTQQNVHISFDTGGLQINGGPLAASAGAGSRAYRRRKILDVQPETTPARAREEKAPSRPENASMSETGPAPAEAPQDSAPT